MTAPGSAQSGYYRPAEVAAMLRCSPWWIKEQARNRRIPYSWIGGSYLFTAEHVAEIVRLFERRPAENVGAANVTSMSVYPSHVDGQPEPTIRLSARPPRRARAGVEPRSSAA